MIKTGDNLLLLEELDALTIQFIYADPPFGKGKRHNLIDDSEAHEKAYQDTWSWSESDMRDYREFEEKVNKSPVEIRLWSYYEHIRQCADPDSLAYIFRMGPRLIQCHRVLTSTGTIAVHCSPTYSHRLREVLDAIFGADHFVSEIVWKRSNGHSDGHRPGAMHDTILIYSKSHSYTYNQYLPEGLKARIKRHYRHKDDNGRLYSLDNPTANGLDGGGYSYEWKGVFRQWRFSKERMEELDRLGRLQDPKRPKGVVRIKRFLDEHKGVVVQDLWTDIPYVSYFSRERVPNYVGQKPVGLISRLIEMFSNPGDLVLDPFLGSGTTAIAAQRLRRQWLGFELTHKSAKVAFERIYKEFGTCCEKNVYPSDIEDARYLAKSDPHALERWVVRQIKGRHSGKKSADGGIDGTLELLTFAGPVRFVVQVTGGANISDHFGNFVATVLTKHKAGLYFAFRDSITDSMRVRAFNSGSLVLECRGDSYSIPKIQIVEIETTLSLGNSPLLPGLVVPYNYDQTHEAMERRSKEQMAMMLQGML